MKTSATKEKARNRSRTGGGTEDASRDTGDAVQARVTIAIVPRERFSVAVQSLESVLANTSTPFELVYVDAGSPPAVQAEVAFRVEEAGGTLIRVEETLSPNAARNRAIPHVRTEFVLFIDNDVRVEEGWLDALLACANSTGAAVVGPLTMIDTASGVFIHLLEGTIEINKQTEPHQIFARHERMMASREDVTASGGELEPQKCDFAEFHTMLVRRSVLDEIGPFDEGFETTVEHIDFALDLARGGYSVYAEPRAVVTYLAPHSLALSERGFFTRRWSDDKTERSINRLAEKWKFDSSAGECETNQTFIYDHQALCPLPDLEERPAPEHLAGILGHGYAQTPGQLYQQMSEAGWSLAARVRMKDACDLAISLFSDLFRACGKPFLCHGIGTASILLRYGAPLALVEAGLLHAAYSHGRYPGLKNLPLRKRRKKIRKVIGRGAEGIIDRYHTFDWGEGPPAGALSELDCRDAGVFLLRMANDLEEQLDLALAYTAKPVSLSPVWSVFFRDLAKELGVSGLAAELDQARSATDSAEIPAPLLNDLSFSFAVGQWTRKREGFGRRAKNMKSKWRQVLRRISG